MKFKVQQFSIKSSDFYIDIFDENKNLLKSIECVNFESLENELSYIFNVEELNLPLHSKIVICLRTEGENMSGTNRNKFVKVAVEQINNASIDEYMKL